MAILSTGRVTLLDVAKMPNAKDVADVINLLVQYNPILMDAPALECNDGTKHKTTMLTGLPSVIWGALYQGVQASKASRQQVEDTTGFMESASEVDTRMVDFIEDAKEKASIMLQEADPHLEALAQEASSAIFYHDSRIDPKKPMGFAPRFSDTSAQNGSQIVLGGGAGADNTSMWMITWDRSTNHLIYPKGSAGGIERKTRMDIPTQDGDGNTFFVHREDFKQHLGISNRDWRYVCRGANIDVSDLSEDASTGADIISVLTQMYYKHEGRRAKKGSTYVYVNPTIMEYLDYQARNVPTNLQLQFSETGVNASEVLKYRGMGIRECDALLNSESVVS